MPKIKNILIFIAIVVVLLLTYIFFIKPSPKQAGLVSGGTSNTLPNMDGSSANTNTSNANSLVQKDFLALFSNAKNIKLDDAIFSDPAFGSLRDSSITLTLDGTEGRPNPFAQFGNDTVVVSENDSSTESPTPTTSAPAKP